MRITYVLLSATFGMHQYTADPANRMVLAGHDVSLVTSSRLPRDRYSPAVAITTPMNNVRTGLSPESLNLRRLKQVEKAILATEPDVVHFSGPHLWNPALVQRVREAGVRVVHTIHDLEPHKGTRLGILLPLWNRSIVSPPGSAMTSLPPGIFVHFSVLLGATNTSFHVLRSRLW